MTWSGLEPGTAPTTRPSAPAGSRRVRTSSTRPSWTGTVAAHQDGRPAGRFHIHTIIDMHQDVYNQDVPVARGHPAGPCARTANRSSRLPDRWSIKYATPPPLTSPPLLGKQRASGNLQGQFDEVWGERRGTPSAVEPLGRRIRPVQRAVLASLTPSADDPVDVRPPPRVLLHRHRLYTGPRRRGPHRSTARRRSRRRRHPHHSGGDPRHLVFDEPDNYAVTGTPPTLGPMTCHPRLQRPRLLRRPEPGDRGPDHPATCAAEDEHSPGVRAEPPRVASATNRVDRPDRQQFGATSNPTCSRR